MMLGESFSSLGLFYYCYFVFALLSFALSSSVLVYVSLTFVRLSFVICLTYRENVGERFTAFILLFLESHSYQQLKGKCTLLMEIGGALRGKKNKLSLSVSEG